MHHGAYNSAVIVNTVSGTWKEKSKSKGHHHAILEQVLRCGYGYVDRYVGIYIKVTSLVYAYMDHMLPGYEALKNRVAC